MKTYSDGEILKALRERFNPPRGTTKAQAAKVIGFSDKYIYAVLAGAQPLTPEMGRALGFKPRPRVWERTVGWRDRT